MKPITAEELGDMRAISIMQHAVAKRTVEAVIEAEIRAAELLRYATEQWIEEMELTEELRDDLFHCRIRAEYAESVANMARGSLYGTAFVLAFGLVLTLLQG